MPVDDDRIRDLLLSWQESHLEGRPVAPTELCRDCPELLEPLLRQIQLLGSEPQGADLADTLVRPLNAAQTLQPRGGTGKWPAVEGYEILGEIGRGGMGVVYKARQAGLNRLVALKMILIGSHATADDLTRFHREAEAIARLRHPNLVEVYEVGQWQTDGTGPSMPYLSMEYVEGGDLQQKLAGKPLPPRQAAELAETLSLAVHAVHQHGIVHRDLKPSNVLLAADGTPRITDFGLAKQLGVDTGPTVTGGVLGTPSYMAPEQAQGKKDITLAADVYSLGAILYELLTGRPPFRADTPWDTIAQATTEDPVPPRRLQPGVPRDLSTICLKCLHKNPASRYPSAEALATDLRRFLAGEPIKARPAGPGERAVKWVRRRPATAALIGVSGLAVLGFLVASVVYAAILREALGRTARLAEESRHRLVRLHVTRGGQLLDEGDWLDSLVWFAEALVLDQGEPEHERMHRLRIASVLRRCPELAQLLVHDGAVWQARFSPDGRYLVTASEDRTARVWDVASGQPAGPPLSHPGPVLNGSFSPDGRLVATAGTDGNGRVWEWKTGRLAAPPLPHSGTVLDAAFSPDGRLVVTASEDGTARVWETASGKPVSRPLSHGKPVRTASFHPGGRQVVTAGDDGTACVWDVTRGERALPPLKHGGPVTHAEFCPRGRRVATASTDHTGRVWDAASGQPLTHPLRHRAALHWVSFSPDGGQVATASDDQTAHVWDSLAGELLVPPLKHGSALNLVRFSPRGRWLVTASDDNSARVWDAASGDPLTPFLRHQGSVTAAQFSPDERWLVTASGDNTVRVWRVVLNNTRGKRGEEAGPKTPAPPRPRRWVSPDGRLAAVPRRGHGVQVLDAASGEPAGPPVEHGSVVLYAAFTSGGRRLVTASDDNTARLWDVRTGELLARPLRHRGAVRQAAFSPDGRLVLTASDDRTARVWDAETGELVAPPLTFGGTVRSVSFNEDGTEARVTSTSQTQTLDLRLDERPAAELLRLAQVLAGCRIDPLRGMMPMEPDDLRREWENVRGRSSEGPAVP